MADALLGNLPASAGLDIESPARRALRRLLRRKGAVIGLTIIVTFLVLALFAPLIAPYDPIASSWSLVRKPPSAAHWFGTDDLGRDVLSRVIYGARASLMAGVISVGIALGIGVPVGLLAGYRGGFIDGLIGRITDAMLACPFLILAIALAAFLVNDGEDTAAIHRNQVPVFVANGIDAEELHETVGLGVLGRLLADSRGRAADVEGTHRKLRARLAD